MDGFSVQLHLGTGGLSADANLATADSGETFGESAGESSGVRVAFRGFEASAFQNHSAQDIGHVLDRLLFENGSAVTASGDSLAGGPVPHQHLEHHDSVREDVAGIAGGLT